MLGNYKDNLNKKCSIRAASSSLTPSGSGRRVGIIGDTVPSSSSVASDAKFSGRPGAASSAATAGA